MKLHYSPTSPFVRKVNVLATELGIDERLQRIPTNPWQPDEVLLGNNPLSKVPTLITDEGLVLYDSPVICEYLDSEFGQQRFLPASGAARWRTLRLQALADGLLDAAILRFLERKREMPSADWDATQKGAVDRALAVMESEAAAWGESFALGQLTAAVSLGYLDFRFDDEDWRPGHEALATWYEAVSQRPSMLATVPVMP